MGWGGVGWGGVVKKEGWGWGWRIAVWLGCQQGKALACIPHPPTHPPPAAHATVFSLHLQ